MQRPQQNCAIGHFLQTFQVDPQTLSRINKAPFSQPQTVAPMKKLAFVCLMILTLLTAALCLVALIYYDIPI